MAISGTFSNKVVVVTGAAGDIGRATALAFARQGARLALVDIAADAMVSLAKEIEQLGGQCLGLPLDVTREEAFVEAFDTLQNHFGGLDILFNNAGIEGTCSPVDEYSAETFDQVMAVNVRGVFLGMKYAIPVMRQGGGGSIVNTASVAGISGAAGFCAYNASKHAIIGLTRSAAISHGPENIRINAVCPSPVEGAMMQSLQASMQPEDPAAVRELLEQRIPLQRYGKPSDVAAMVCFLCSPEAGFLNGGIYTVDGGMTA